MPDTLDFLTLVEVKVVKALRDGGMTLSAVKLLRGHWPLSEPPHVFASRSMLEAIPQMRLLPEAARNNVAAFLSELAFEEATNDNP